MPTYTRIELNSTQPFHFGKRGVGLNETDVTLPADSLFSAYCSAFANLYGAEALNNFLARFPSADVQATPPLRLSSLMPYCREIYLLPIPYLRPRIREDVLEHRKMFKKIDWVSPLVFRHLASGEDITKNRELIDGSHLPHTVQSGRVWVSKSEQTRLGGAAATLWKIDVRPRVTVDRVTSSSTAYSSGGLYFQADAGLYTLLRWETTVDEHLLAELCATFAALGEQGIGGERTYGYGHFTTNIKSVEFPDWTESSPYYTTLSPYLPHKSERALLSGHARYAITLRRGWLSLPGYSNLRRSAVRMVDTGAILAALDGHAPLGYLADATPDPMRDSGILIRRYGLAWPVPISAQAVIPE